jgi:2-oxoisovalerate dehydrogenase E1 component subunit beta
MLQYSCHLGAPVIFFEPKRLYWKRLRQPRDESEPRSALGARTVRRGSDITVVGYGALIEEVLTAAHRLAGTVDVEVVDLRWIAPMDTDTVLASVARTGRLLMVHEAVGFGGVGAELVAAVAEHGWHDLKSPPRRLAPTRQVYPPADNEQNYLIGVPHIVKAIEEMCR